MYQLTIKRTNQSTTTTKFYKTIKEALQQIKIVAGGSFAEVQAEQAKYQYQFYIKTI